MKPTTREAANLSLMFGIILVTGAAIMVPVGVLLAFVGISASIGFIVVGIALVGGAVWLITAGRRALRDLD